MSSEIKRKIASDTNEIKKEMIADFLKVPTGDLEFFKEEGDVIFENALVSRFEKLQILYTNILSTREDIISNTAPVLKGMATYLRDGANRNTYDFKWAYPSAIMALIKPIENFNLVYSTLFYNKSNRYNTIWFVYKDFVKVLFKTKPENTTKHLVGVLLDLIVFITDNIWFLTLLYTLRMYKGAQSTADDLGFLYSPNIVNGAPKIPNVPVVGNSTLETIFNNLKLTIDGYGNLSLQQELVDRLLAIFKIPQYYFEHIINAMALSTDLEKLGAVVLSIQSLLGELIELIDKLIVEITDDVFVKISSPYNGEPLVAAQYLYIVAYLHLIYYDPGGFGKNEPNVFTKKHISGKIDELADNSKKINSDVRDKFLTDDWDQVLKDIEYISNQF